MKGECRGSHYGAGNRGGGSQRIKVICPECGRMVARNSDGRLRVHKAEVK